LGAKDIQGPVLQYCTYDHHDNCKSDATIWSVTLELSIMLLMASFTLLEASLMMFSVQASLTIVINNCNMFIAEATGDIFSAVSDTQAQYIKHKQ
jgi:hypothetical protein